MYGMTDELNNAWDEYYKLKTQFQQYKRAAPLCDRHKPTGGARGNCLVCAVEEMRTALSQIDYLCGPENDMQVSGYDVHADPQLVVKHVRSILNAHKS